MAGLPTSAVQLLTSGANAHLVTLNADGSPQLSLVWPGVDGDEIVVGHLRFHQKLRNVERDPRVVLSVEATTSNAFGLRDYLVVHGRARVVAGGAPELLAHLAPRFLPAEATFPAPDAPPGWVLRITVDRIAGSGPWTQGE
jgi:PPOX class probable F420-dependent enzyme